MKILFVTNTFSPHVGGVAHSIEAFLSEYRRRGHRVLVFAPEFEDMPLDETDVVRVPAIENFNKSTFSLALPIPGFLHNTVREFEPDIVHSHHPFLLGATALRIAHVYRLPMVFTHHTLYERYTHYAPGGDSDVFKRFIGRLATHYANLCDAVFAPSRSIADLLVKRNVEVPIHVIPTGIDLERFRRGNGPGFRKAMDIPPKTLLFGHIGRLAPEKNLGFLADVAAHFMKREPRAHFLLVGKGPALAAMQAIFSREGLTDRVHTAGILDTPLLSSAYQAMDAFLFTSKTETQGMVLAEAMAAGTPVVALDGPGSRDVVRDGENGRLVPEENVEQFSEALDRVFSLDGKARARMKRNVRKTARSCSLEQCADRALDVYREIRMGSPYRVCDATFRGEWIPDLPPSDWQNIKAVIPDKNHIALVRWNAAGNVPGFHVIRIDVCQWAP